MTTEEYQGIINEEMFKLINELVENGKLKEYRPLYEIFVEEKDELIEIADKSPEEVYSKIIEEYLMNIRGIAKLVPGLTTGIKDSKSGAEIYTYSGRTSASGEMVDENTRFDIASTTKLFTTTLALKLAEEGKFSLDRSVSSYKNGKYKYLNILVEEMAKYYYELRTPGRLDERDGELSKEELDNRLSGTKVAKEKTFVYSDIPFIILKDIMPDSDEYFKKYFNEEMNMLNTSYERFGSLTGGKDGELKEVHDPKARVMERYGINPGHAGVFSTSKDLVKLNDALKNGFLSKESLQKMITPVVKTPMLLDENGIPVMKRDKNGNATGQINISRAMGVYIKHPEGIRVNELPAPVSDEAFAMTGFTGSHMVVDLKNGLTTNILANPISDNNQREVIIDNNKFIIRDCGKVFENGTKFKVVNRTSEVYDKDGNLITKAPYTRITNTLKEEQINVLLKLRLAKNSLLRKVELESQKSEVHDVFETSRSIKM